MDELVTELRELAQRIDSFLELYVVAQIRILTLHYF